jgi:hypothetical protein
MPVPRTELINCHDCGRPISASATTCPNCGSLEPDGPYVHSGRELRRFRGEARNDHTLLFAVLGCGLGGALYGAVTASGIFTAILFGSLYGCLGALIGAPVAFVINMTRHLGR